MQPEPGVIPSGGTSDVTPSGGTEPEDTFDGGAFNPDQLAPELQPGWRQLQAAYTRKTQELADERKQLEALGIADPAEVQQAIELYTAIQDPRNWAQLHTELSQAMQEYGLTPAEADAVAAEALTPDAPQAPDLSGLSDDPDLAPLFTQLQAQQARLDQFEAQQAAARAAQQAEFEHQQIMSSLIADVNAIRSENPTYTDEDIDAILEHSSFFNGDVRAAQQSLESHFQRRMGRYLASKQSALGVSGSVPPAGASATTPVEGEETLEDVARAMEEHLRQLQASGDLD